MILPNIGVFCQCLLLTDGKPTYICLVMTDVIVIIFVTIDVIGRCYLPCGCDMADDLCHCDRWYSHFIVIVADGKPLLR